MVCKCSILLSPSSSSGMCLFVQARVSFLNEYQQADYSGLQQDISSTKRKHGGKTENYETNENGYGMQTMF